MTRTVSVGMATHLAQTSHNFVTCWKVTLTSGTVLGFTSHDEDLIISGWVSVDAQLNGTYLAASGYSATDTSTTAALNVDNMDVMGPMVSPAITENDLNAGLWDYAKIVVFLVSWENPALGPIWQRVGRLGEVTLEVGPDAFKTELRGLSQAYTTRIGDLTTPGCLNLLYDSRCQVDPNSASPNFTAYGVLTGVNSDGVTYYDTARTETGPTGSSLGIIGVSNGNPGVVTMSSGALNLIDGQLITLSGIGGMPLLNVVTIVRNPSGSTFQLTIDTSDTAVYGTYTSGGTVTLFGGDSGWFDHGMMTILNVGSPLSLNAGLSREVKSYVPGQWTLQEPFPYNAFPGESYKMTAGCDKSPTTCRVKFSNKTNFRGFDWLQGLDKMVQVARHNA